ncbi:hypothetical protein [Thiocapsa bogorovii]|uniref:hypothetical protein n=1 Tax=Thiocapsa bogorovii TaxID=521689 RepID=UPI001E6011F2|nr:hypothetical protein [Thiocapsa bogorovii]UHD15079.1 hypothetical protein LT988_17570 [Thiocapsa bogorovii]
MLYLGEGARQISVSGDRIIQVFPDFSDPNAFYYLPNVPHIASMADGTPAIRLLVYREDLDTIDDDDDEAVAFLSLDVDVSWPADAIDEAISKLQLEDNLMQKPRLAPIFFREGSVKLMLLDAVTPEEEEAHPGEAQPTEFVIKILGAGSPSLYGDNRAIFQAMLPKKGAVVLSQALDGVTPIGVVYSLTFAGLQPAFNIRARVDWQRVVDHFSEQKELDLLFYERDIQESIDSLVDERAIEIVEMVEGIGAAAMDAEREQVMNTVRQLIFDKFFEATFERETAVGDAAEDRVTGALTNIAQNGLTLGIGYTYRRKEVKIDELRTLDLDYTARKAAERTIYPQAHMHKLLTGSAVTQEQLVTIIDGSDAVWKTLPFRVSAAAAWETDGIAGISVDIEYEDADSGAVRTWSTFLDREHDSDEHRDWMDRTSGNAFRYKYEVVFQDDSVPGPSPKVDSGGWIDHEGSVLVIQPRDLYRSHQLEVMVVDGFSFERWPAVQAILRYHTEDETFEHYEDGVLKKGALAFTTRFRTDRDMIGTREVKLIYLGATGERVDTQWMPMPQDQWVVEDPHGSALDIRAVVAGDRSKIANLIVDFEYVDEDAGIHETRSLSFSQEDVNMPKTWRVHLADPLKRRYRYRMTLVTTDGEFMETGWLETDAPTLPVGEKYVRQLAVEIVTGELAPGVEAVEVSLVYDDEDNGLHEEESYRLGSDSRADWKIQLQDAGKRDYQVTMNWIREDGFNQRVGPTTRTDGLIIVPGAPPETL